MKKLDLVKINSCAPYAVKEDTQEGAYEELVSWGQSANSPPCGPIPQNLAQTSDGPPTQVRSGSEHRVGRLPPFF